MVSKTGTVVVTGATSGVGEAVAAQLAAEGHQVLAVARNAATADDACRRLAGSRPVMMPEFLLADLSDLSQVRSLAREIVSRVDRLDALVLNAGVARPRREQSVDGYEMDFATNLLSPFLLTRALEGLLRANAPARIVTLSSSAQSHVKAVDLEAMVTGVNFHHLRTYSATKLLTVWFTTELARRWSGSGVTANTADPGFVRTRLGRDAPGTFGLFLKVVRPLQVSPAKAARTPAHLATSPDVAAVTGRLFANCKEVPLSGLAKDRQQAEQLWSLATRLTEAGQ